MNQAESFEAEMKGIWDENSFYNEWHCAVVYRTIYQTKSILKRTPAIMTEKVIRDCASEFAKELSKYATKLDISSWKEPSITLKVSFTTEHGPKLSLTFSDAEYGNQVKHTCLGILMDEVYRRCQYDGRAAISVDTESAALHSLTHQPTAFTEDKE